MNQEKEFKIPLKCYLLLFSQNEYFVPENDGITFSERITAYTDIFKKKIHLNDFNKIMTGVIQLLLNRNCIIKNHEFKDSGYFVCNFIDPKNNQMSLSFSITDEKYEFLTARRLFMVNGAERIPNPSKYFCSLLTKDDYYFEKTM